MQQPTAQENNPKRQRRLRAVTGSDAGVESEVCKEFIGSGVGRSACLDRLSVYRAKLFAEIERELKRDGHCKRYEGRIELHWPCYFGGDYSIHLACYVLGPSRGYDYCGKSCDECMDKAEADLEAWIKTNRENDTV